MQVRMEHARLYGVESLSTAELFTLVLYGEKTSRQREKALQLIQRFLADHSDTSALLGTDAHELFASEFDEPLALRLSALLALHRRLARPAAKLYRISVPRDAARLLLPEMSPLKTEHMRVLVLNSKNEVIVNQELYQGTVNTSILRIAEVFRAAMVRNCPAILLCHNHPSGDPTPSPEDISVTEQLVAAGKLLDIELVDHLIIGRERYISLKERLRW